MIWRKINAEEKFRTRQVEPDSRYEAFLPSPNKLTLSAPMLPGARAAAGPSFSLPDGTNASGVDFCAAASASTSHELEVQVLDGRASVTRKIFFAASLAWSIKGKALSCNNA